MGERRVVEEPKVVQPTPPWVEVYAGMEVMEITHGCLVMYSWGQHKEGEEFPNHTMTFVPGATVESFRG